MQKIDIIKVQSLNVWYFISIYLIELSFKGLMYRTIRMLYIKIQSHSNNFIKPYNINF